MSGIPGREELIKRRSRATNAPVSFSINPVTNKLEVRNAEGSVLEDFSSGTIQKKLEVPILDRAGSPLVDVRTKEPVRYKLLVSFGRDELGRLSLLVRCVAGQSHPAFISVFQRRLILPPGTSVSAFLEKEDGLITIEPCLTGTIYYLDAEPSPVEVPPDKVRMVMSKNLVSIGRTVVLNGEIPEDGWVDAEVQGSLRTEDKQTPKNNAGVAVGSWLQNAGVSLLGLPNPQAAPPATVVKVTSGTPELSAPAPQSLTPNFDPSLVPAKNSQSNQELTQSVKVIALRSDEGAAALPRKPFLYEEGSTHDLAAAAETGLNPRPLENPSLVSAPPAETLDQKPPGDVAGNAVVKVLRSFLGMPEAKTVDREAAQLSGRGQP